MVRVSHFYLDKTGLMVYKIGTLAELGGAMAPASPVFP
jgi:hypothetical protein